MPRVLFLLALVAFLLPGQAIRRNTGFTRNQIERNDDGSSTLQNLGFNVNFFGRQRSAVYVNNNGNFTFDQALETYTPEGLSGLRREIIAGFWADVDTRNPQSALVTFGRDVIDGRNAFGANFINVGYFANRADKLNSFQIILIDRTDTGPGNFDIEFNYEKITWETGDVSGGFNGLGGVSARVGYSNGSGAPGSSFELAGSGLPGSFLDSNPNGLIRRSINSDVPGRIIFQARNGGIVQTLSVLPSALRFVAASGGTPPPARSVAVTSSGNAASYNVNVLTNNGGDWLRATPTSGRTPGTVSISINPAGLGPGSYVGKVNILPQETTFPAQAVSVELVIATPPANCTFALGAGNLTVTGAASTQAVEVRAPAGCLWNAVSNASWITLTNADGSGDGAVTLNIAQNPGGVRAGTVTIAGQTFTVLQTGGTLATQVQVCRVSTLAGTGEAGFAGDNGPATSARLNAPTDAAGSPGGDIWVADSANNRVRRWGIDLIMRTYAGSGNAGNFGDGGSVFNAALQPFALAIDSNANLFVADPQNHVVRRITPFGQISTVAGTGTAGFTGDGNNAREAQLNQPRGIAVGSGDVIYIADTGNHRIRAIGRDGVIRTFSGTGRAGFGGDEGFAASASLNGPQGLWTDPNGVLWIADTGNHRVRRVGTDAIIRTIAGQQESGFAGDGRPATQARLNGPTDVAVDSAGNVFIADRANHRIRRVAPDGIITTVAGTGSAGFNGDGIGGLTQLSSPTGLGVDLSDRLIVADTGNHRLRRIACGLGLPPGESEARVSVSVNGASGGPAATPHSFVTVVGQNLATTTTTWDNFFPDPQTLPIDVAGVRVRVNGRDAYPYFVSPGQINFVTPNDTARGTVPVEVITARGSAYTTLTLADYAPGLFSFVLEGRTYAVALFNGERTLVAPETPGLLARPARVGDNLVLYATGVGPVVPPPPEGRVFPAPLAAADLSRITVTINGIAAPVQYAGLISPGLYQINFQVPAGVGTGNLPVVVEAAGVRSQSDVVLAFRQ